MIMVQNISKQITTNIYDNGTKYTYKNGKAYIAKETLDYNFNKN